MSELFSIVIPTYHSKTYAPECVRSALKQTYPNIEVIVDDNTSKDGTVEALKSEFGQDSRFRLFARTENIRLCPGWNRGMLEAKGDYLLLLHDDNLLHPQFVEKVVAAMKLHHAKVAYTDCSYFDGETPKEVFHSLPATFDFDRMGPGPRTVAHVFRYERMIPISAFVFKKECLEGKPPFDLKYQHDPCMDLVIRLTNKYGALHLKLPLAAMRSHKDQAPNWKDPDFPRQYEDLLQKQHSVGQTERWHYLQQSAAAGQDMCRRLSKLNVPLGVYLKFHWRWFKAEARLASYALTNWLRKINWIRRTFTQSLKRP